MTTSERRAVFFDMDGVLLDSYEAWFAMLQQAARSLGGQNVTRDMFKSTWGQGLAADIQTFFPHLQLQELSDHYEKHFGPYAQHVVVHPQAEWLFAELRRRELLTAVITNTPLRLAELALSAAKLEPDTLVGSKPDLKSKPAPDMMWRACQIFDIQPHETMMVGDSRFDRDAAAGAGVFFVGYGGIEGDATIQQLTDVLDLI